LIGRIAGGAHIAPFIGSPGAVLSVRDLSVDAAPLRVIVAR
jgi:hypothetical protein